MCVCAKVPESGSEVGWREAICAQLQRARVATKVPDFSLLGDQEPRAVI